MNQLELKANACKRLQALENACEQVAVGLSFNSNASRKWREIFYPIRQNQSKTRITFDTQLKAALMSLTDNKPSNLFPTTGTHHLPNYSFPFLHHVENFLFRLCAFF